MSTQNYLSPEHREELEKGSGIIDLIIRKRGYRSITNPDDLPKEFASYQRRSGLLIPIHTVNSKVECWQLKPDSPRTDKDGKPLKYETAAGARQVIDVPPHTKGALDNPTVPLWITEGAKKVDSGSTQGLGVTIGLQGVWGWRGTNEHGGKTALADWEQIALNRREVVLAFDSDVMTKKSVRKALERLSDFLKSKGARVKYLLMPDLPDGAKCGLDDWFAQGNTRDALFQHIHDSLDESSISDVPDTIEQIDIVRLDEVEAKPIDWIWRNWLPKGMFSLLGGYAGDGKSTITMSLAATLSNGGILPDGTRADQMNTLLLAAEDDVAHVVKPRLEVHGANTERVHFLRGFKSQQKGNRLLDLKRDVESLRYAVAKHDISLVIIDPISSYLPSTDKNSEGEVRAALGPLVQLAEETGVAILGIMHIGKADGQTRAMQKLMGSTAFIALARCIWMVNDVPEDMQVAEQPKRKIFGVTKSNYSVAPSPIMFSRPLDGAMEFHGALQMSIDDLFNGKSKSADSEKRISPSDEAADWLLEYLDGEPKSAKPLLQAAELAGIKEHSLKAAKQRLRIISRNEGSYWAWYPPVEKEAAS